LGISSVFFKTLKQNLKVKNFVGVSENALRIKIWTALITLLVIKWLPLSFESRVGLLEYGRHASSESIYLLKELRGRLDEPYATPPLIPEPEQLRLALR
jgi:IS4 transposase